MCVSFISSTTITNLTININVYVSNNFSHDMTQAVSLIPGQSTLGLWSLYFEGDHQYLLREGWHEMNATDQASPVFYEVHTTLAKFGLHMGNMKFNTQNKE